MAGVNAALTLKRTLRADVMAGDLKPARAVRTDQFDELARAMNLMLDRLEPAECSVARGR